MREIKDLHEPFIIWLRERGVPYIYHRGDRKSGIHSGHPDFTLLWMGRTVMIECKTPSGSLSAIQIKRIDFLQRAGNRVEIAFTLEQCVEAAQSILCDHGAPETLLPQQNGSPEGQANSKNLRSGVEIPQTRMNQTSDDQNERVAALAEASGSGDPPPQNFRIAKILGQDWVIAPDQDNIWDRIRRASAADLVNFERVK